MWDGRWVGNKRDWLGYLMFRRVDVEEEGSVELARST